MPPRIPKLPRAGTPCLLAGAALAMLAALSTLPLPAQPAPQASPRLEARFSHQDQPWFQNARRDLHGPDQKGADGPHHRAGFDLLCLYHEFDDATRQRTPAQKTQAVPPAFRSTANPFLPIIGDDVLVDIICESPGMTPRVTAALTRLGFQNPRSKGCLASGRLPISQIQAASNVTGLKFLRPAYRITHVGNTTSQGLTALQADAAALIAPGFDGSGVTIGVLSDSYDTALAPATTAAQDVVNGDLPAAIDILDDSNTGGTDEGRAMMQLITDLAPGAAQKFHTAFNGQADFAQGILELQTQGCDIIVDDVFYFAEPYFQDGVIAQAVDTAVNSGALYFSSAGNSARNSYEDAFRASISGVTGLGGGPLHDFDPGPGDDIWQEFTVPVGASIIFGLQWDEAHFSVSGPPGAQNDLDIYLTGSGAGQFTVFAGVISDNLGNDPIELFQFVNNGSTDLDGIPGPDTVFNVLIEHKAGPTPQRLKYIYFPSGTVTFNEHATLSSTISGHANAAHAIAVGASAFFNTPAFGTSPPLLNFFSSAGNTPIFFDTSGNRLVSPIIRPKPEFIAADGGNNSFFGIDSAADADAFPNFFGTSAAAPHAAAVAALMLEKAGGPGSLTQSQVLTALQNTAIDMDLPGFDANTGAGLVNAQAAMLEIPLAYDLWTEVQFNGSSDPLVTGLDVDPDGDGQINASEYFTGGDPKSAKRFPFTAFIRNNQEFVATFERSKDAPVDFASLEISTDLINWSPLLATPVLLQDLGDRLLYEVTFGAEPTPHVFARFAFPIP